MKWMANNLSRDVFVNIMDQYHPAAHVGKAKHPRRSTANLGQVTRNVKTGENIRYEEINRHVTKEELSSVRQAAEKAGLWRFCDPPKHDGFSL